MESEESHDCLHPDETMQFTDNKKMVFMGSHAVLCSEGTTYTELY